MKINKIAQNVMIEEGNELTLEELKKIVLGIKMVDLTFVENDAIDEIKYLIQDMPSSEKIDTMKPEELQQLQQGIGIIERLIEIYGKRDPEFKARYEARTGLPPRYKVLDWRGDMKTQAKKFVKELIRVSSTIDDSGKGTMSNDLIKCAKRVQEEEIGDAEVADIINQLRRAGFEEESNIIKEAAWWSGMGEAFRGIKEQFQLGDIKGDLKSINQTLMKALQKAQQKYQTVQDPNVQKQISELHSLMEYMAGIGMKAYNIVDVTEEEVDVAQPAQDQSPQPGQSIQFNQSGQVMQGTVKGIRSNGLIDITLQDGRPHTLAPSQVIPQAA